MANENVHFKIGNDIYIVYASHTTCYNSGYFSAILNDGKTICISTTTGDLLTWERDSTVMQSIMADYCVPETMDKPFLLKINSMNG